MRQRCAGAGARVHGRSVVADQYQPAVAVIEWVDPPFSAGHWVPDLAAAAGGRPVAAYPGGRSTQTSWEQIVAAGPELAVVAPCGFRLDGAAAQAELAARQLPGVPVWALDADGLVVRPGPRLVDGVEALASILHPGQVPTAPADRIRRIA